MMARRSRVLALASLCACFDPKLAADGRPDSGAQIGTPFEPDAAASGSSHDGGPGHHPLCRSGPDAAHAPSTTALSIDADVQNAWQAVDCSAVPVLARCSNYGCPHRSVCIYPEADTLGYCVDYPPGVSSAFTGDEQPLAPTSYRDGACVTHVSNEQHAALCCAQIPGVDCERWPRATPSPPGALCARDDQCETGLVCVQTSEQCQGALCTYASVSFGRCACPEASAGTIGNDVNCSHASR